MPDLELPESLSINAWTGENLEATPVLSDAHKQWSTSRAFPRYSVLLAATPPSLRNWRHPEVGWGIVLPDNDKLPEVDRATANDAPDAIRKLVSSRPNAVVLRYRQDVASLGFLRRYYANGAIQDLAITGGSRGTADKCIPWYLLLYGGPQSIPWEFQYRLNLDFFVGRLDLEGEALERYVEALVSEWSTSGCQRASPVVWSTDHGPNDITHLMRLAIGEPLKAKFTDDNETRSGLRSLFGVEATPANLLTKLGEARPALVVTTSHGMTGPLSDPVKMKKQLGWLVAGNHTPIDPDAILGAWEPDGAIWYSHACCSAGGDGRTIFKGLVSDTSAVARVLQGVANLGPAVASCPRALLGARKPLRAFIGHVEPTFDLTLQAETRQLLTNALIRALYDDMYQADPVPVGLAFYESYRLVGSLFAQWDQQVGKVASAETSDIRKATRLAAMRTKLTALDRQAMVILGDPTVTLPSL